MADTDSSAAHRRIRNRWYVAAVVVLAAAIGARWLPPWVRWLAPAPASWLACLIGAGYHTGWLRRDRQEGDQ